MFQKAERRKSKHVFLVIFFSSKIVPFMR